MRKTFVALGALMIGGGLAMSASAQSVFTNTNVSSDVSYTNNLAATLDASSTNTIDISITGKVVVAGVVSPDSIGQSLVDSKQILYDNTLTFLPTIEAPLTMTTNTIVTNTVSLGAGGGAFMNVQGNIGVNLNAGENNAQDNSVAITTVQSENQGLKADVVRLQESVSNWFNNTSLQTLTVNNTATVEDGTFNDSTGNIGANISAGHMIGQANGLAVSVAQSTTNNVVLASSNVGALQNVTNNRSYVGTTTNTSTIGAVGINFAGNIGLNVATGSNILQSNSLGVTAVKAAP